MTDQVTGHPEQVRRLFDEKAATWSAKYAPGGPLTERLTQLANGASFHVPTGGQVLDLGCGTGDLARCLSGAGLQVTGCDISPSMLDEAAATDPRGAVEWVRLQPDWQVLPFPAAAFDAVIASSVLEYVHSPALVLAECARVLRPGAVMLATVPDVTHPVRWLEEAARVVALAPGACAAVARRRPDLGAYLTYLRISRQRHTVHWWALSAARTGLLNIPVPPNSGQRTPLRLLTFQRPGGHS